MSLIFVNYRRTDAGWPANWLVEKLIAAFGQDAVAYDVRHIDDGQNFPEWIEEHLQKATVFLLLLGKDWLLAHDDVGKRRIDDPDDWVRKEIRYALNNEGCRVIPIFLDGYRFPNRDGVLPDDIKDLLSRQARHIEHANSEVCVQGLIKAIKLDWHQEDVVADDKPDAGSAASVFRPPVYGDAMPRPALFDRIHGAIQENSVITIGGLSGSGKTWLMASYVEEVFKKQTKRPVYWFTSSANESLEDLLAQFNLVFPFTAGSTISRCKQLLGHLSARSALLVIDDFSERYDTLVEVALGVKPPCHLVLLSQSRVEPKGTGNFPHHIDAEGFLVHEVQKLVQAKGTPAASRHAADITSKTGGMPFAINLFCTLVKAYNRNPVELLSGSMNRHERVQEWFDDIVVKLKDPARFLLPRLALTDGPFGMGVVKNLMSRRTGLDQDAAQNAFSELQRNYLVNAASADFKWKVHDLAASLGRKEISDKEAHETHELLGKYFNRSINLTHPKSPLTNREFLDAVRAYRHFRQSPRTCKDAEKLLSNLSRSVKRSGFYKLYAELLADAVKGPETRDHWLDYHYGHCLMILGEHKKALQYVGQFINRPAKQGDRRLGVSMRRLYADLLASSEREDEAIDILKSILAEQTSADPSDTVYQQVTAALAQIYIRKGELDTAEHLNNPLLAQALKENHKHSSAIALVRQGTITWKRGHYQDAISTLQTAFGLFKDEGDRRGMAWSLANLCEAQLLARQEAAALPHFTELQALAKEIGECGKEYRDFIMRAWKLATDQRLKNIIRSEQKRVR